MVTMGVPTAYFGPDWAIVNNPNPANRPPPEPHYPGISQAKFNPMEAIIIYREALTRDNKIRGAHLVRAGVDAAGSEPPGRFPRVADLMPGYSSLIDHNTKFGFEKHSVTGVSQPVGGLNGSLAAAAAPSEAGSQGRASGSVRSVRSVSRSASVPRLTVTDSVGNVRDSQILSGQMKGQMAMGQHAAAAEKLNMVWQTKDRGLMVKPAHTTEDKSLIDRCQDKSTKTLRSNQSKGAMPPLKSHNMKEFDAMILHKCGGRKEFRIC